MLEARFERPLVLRKGIELELRPRAGGREGEQRIVLMIAGAIGLAGQAHAAAEHLPAGLAVDGDLEEVARRSLGPRRDRRAGPVDDLALAGLLAQQAVAVEAEAVVGGADPAVPGQESIGCGRVLLGDLVAERPGAAAGRRRPHDVGEDREAGSVAGGLGAAQQLDPQHLRSRDALEDVRDRLALGDHPLAVDQHVADRARETAPLRALGQGEARRPPDHVERRARRELGVESGIVGDARLAGGRRLCRRGLGRRHVLGPGGRCDREREQGCGFLHRARSWHVARRRS